MLTIFQKHGYYLLLLIFIFIFVQKIYGNDFEQFVDIPDSTDSENLNNNGIIIEDESSNNITYICRNITNRASSVLRYFVPQIPSVSNGCDCSIGGRLECNLWPKGANIKPIDESFEVIDVRFSNCNISILNRDKILPDNEDTVKRIFFTSTDIQYIEEGAFDKFISLEHFGFSETKMTEINENVFTPTFGSNLATLSFVNNSLITHLDPMIFKNLANLKVLYLGYNSNLKEFTYIFPKLDNLEWFTFSYCGFEYLKEDVFKNLVNLEAISITGNKFSTIPSTFKYLPNLNTLQASKNSFTKIETNSFITNSKLASISFHDCNSLLQIDDCAFCGISNLTWVGLGCCHKLSFIHENAFGAFSTGVAPTLTHFIINECNITVLPEKLLNWKNMTKINIGGNPFVCNCSMAWLFYDLLSDSSIYDKKISRRYHGHKYILGCFPPTDSDQKHFMKRKFLESCKNTTSTTSTKSFWITFFILSGFMISAGIYAYRHYQQHFFGLPTYNFIISRYRNIVPENE